MAAQGHPLSFRAAGLDVAGSEFRRVLRWRLLNLVRAHGLPSACHAAESTMSIKLRKGTDESGRPIYLIERLSSVRTSLDDSLKSLGVPCSMLGPDHEQLAADGDWFRGVQSGKRYRLDAYDK